MLIDASAPAAPALEHPCDKGEYLKRTTTSLSHRTNINEMIIVMDFFARAPGCVARLIRAGSSSMARTRQ
jgi:hypothetical protein